MIITNTHNLTEGLVKACEASTYPPKEGRYGATDLIKPPKQRTLKIINYNRIVKDAIDMVWALLGTGYHTVVNRHEAPERKIEIPFEVNNIDYIVVGKPDNVEGTEVVDRKVTSAWSFVYNDGKEWEQQVNIYAWLLRNASVEITGVRSEVIFRDWMRTKALQSADYPQTQIVNILFRLWSEQEGYDFIVSKLMEHIENPMRDCTDEECWKKEDTYKVMKNENVRSLKNYTGEEGRENAHKYIYVLEQKHPKDNFYIKEVVGEYIKCERYCDVNVFCSQYLAREVREPVEE